jgi:hypothetical protein
MVKWLLSFLLQRLLILFVLVVASAIFPVASFLLAVSFSSGCRLGHAPSGRCSSQCSSARASGWAGSTCSRGVPPEAAT